MTRIGITGGIGSGKTYVCQLLKQRGIPVYHCDDEAKRLMTESTVIRREMCKLIGKDAYKGQELNKPIIAQYLFASDDHAKCINTIVHPVVRQDFLQWTKQQDCPIVAQECALLFESGFQDTVDFTIEVYAPQPLRIQRATQRDQVAPEHILARMAQQMDEEEKRQRADFCILNDGTTDLDGQLDLLLARLNNEKNSKKTK